MTLAECIAWDARNFHDIHGGGGMARTGGESSYPQVEQYYRQN